MRRKLFIISVIIILLFCIPLISLFVFSKVHYQAAHDEFVDFINHELDGEITFEDFSFSYLSKFPSGHIELTGVSVHDGDVEVLYIAKLDILLNLRAV